MKPSPILFLLAAGAVLAWPAFADEDRPDGKSHDEEEAHHEVDYASTAEGREAVSDLIAEIGRKIEAEQFDTVEESEEELHHTVEFLLERATAEVSDPERFIRLEGALHTVTDLAHTVHTEAEEGHAEHVAHAFERLKASLELLDAKYRDAEMPK